MSEVGRRSVEDVHPIAGTTEHDVAVTAQEASHRIRLVVMVDFEGEAAEHPTDGATAVLKLKQRKEFVGTQLVPLNTADEILSLTIATAPLAHPNYCVGSAPAARVAAMGVAVLATLARAFRFAAAIPSTRHEARSSGRPRTVLDVSFTQRKASMVYSAAV